MKRQALFPFPFFLKNTVCTCLCILSLGFSQSSISQTVQYSLNATSVSYSSVSGSMVFGSYADDAISAMVPIGFRFHMGDSSYSHCRISTNGFLSFNVLATDSYVNGLATIGGTNLAPLVAPLWDDLQVSSTGSIAYNLSGIAPNRVFTVEWRNMEWDFNSQTSVVSFQCKLYENSQKVEFHYKDNGFTPGTASASCGIAGVSVSNFYSINNFSSAPVASQGVETNTISAKPATGQLYQWQLSTVMPVKFLSFDAFKQLNRVSLKWKTTETISFSHYVVERSNDGKNYSALTSVSSNNNTALTLEYTATDPKPGMGLNYYRVKAVEKDGSVRFGPVRSVAFNTTAALFVPTIVQSSLLPLHFSRSPGQYSIKIFSASGTCLSNKSYSVSAGDETILLKLPGLTPGTYFVQAVNTQSGYLSTHRIIKAG